MPDGGRLWRTNARQHISNGSKRMPTSLVRQDARGLYIVTNGQRYRSGPLNYGLRPGLRCDDGGLAAGTKVKVRRLSCTPVAVLKSADGGDETYWETEGEKDALAAKRAFEAANPDVVAANRRQLADLIRPTRVIHAGSRP